jgi:hypothetical protein
MRERREDVQGGRKGEVQALASRCGAKIKLIEDPCPCHYRNLFLYERRRKNINNTNPHSSNCSFLLATMANKAQYKTTFEPEHTIQPIYTGGSVALDQSGRILATTLGEDALLTDLSTGKQLARIEGVCFSACILAIKNTC